MYWGIIGTGLVIWGTYQGVKAILDTETFDSINDAKTGLASSEKSEEGECSKGKNAKSKIDRRRAAKERAEDWKREATEHPEKYSKENLERMRKGKAPIGHDGKPMERHHEDGTHQGPRKPMTQTDHRIGENYLKNHPWLKK